MFINTIMKTLSNFDIESFFAHDPRFGGVINKNDLEKYPNKIFIANLDARQNPGSHWILVSNINPSYVYFFDSYGTDPPEHILKLMRNTGKHLFRNTRQLQSLATNSCGEFCMYMAKELLKGRNPNDIVHDFGENLVENENSLKKYFENKIGT